VKRISTLAFLVIGIAAAVALVILLAPNANPNPDGLEKVAADQGLDTEVRNHALADAPLADYGVSGVDNRYVGTWVAGLIGVAVTFVVGAGIVYVVRRARRPAPPPTNPPVAA
jgi:cobalt/nickel transport system permease protein